MNPVSPQQSNPVMKVWKSELDTGGPGLRSQVPHHRHHLPGDGTLAGRGHDPEPHLAGGDDAGDVRGDQPLLAKAKGIKAGDWVKVKSVRGEVMARANVTRRVAPFYLRQAAAMQSTVEMVALPWHFGFAGLITGGPDTQRITPPTSWPPWWGTPTP